MSAELSITITPAGGPFHDPAFLVNFSNQKDLVLLDCGTLHTLKTRELLKVRWVLLSHLHIDHLIGFDHLLRVRLFSDLPLAIFGPEGTAETIAHRLKGYHWNLTSGSPLVVEAIDLSGGQALRFRCHHQFAPEPLSHHWFSPDGLKLESDLRARWIPVKHGLPCVAYRLERDLMPRFSMEKCRSLGLSPGPWVRQLTEGQPLELEVEGQRRNQDWLAEQLLEPREPETLGYLTDTLLDQELADQLSEFYHRTDLLLSEAAYRQDEEQTARQNLHMTTAQVAGLCQRAEVQELRIFHLSRRHQADGPERHLAEVQALFPHSSLVE